MPNKASTMTIAARERVGREGMRAAAGGQPFLLRAARIAGELVGRRGRQHQRIESRRARQAREHVAIATVVARATNHRDALRLRPARA